MVFERKRIDPFWQEGVYPQAIQDDAPEPGGESGKQEKEFRRRLGLPAFLFSLFKNRFVR
ncbi:MAG: hypothetical protein ABJF10_04935 [Chthoniobacter sp.]